jgi:TatD DNase family protein
LELHVIDTHAHLDMPEFDADREDVVRRAAQAGIKTILTIGIDLESSSAAVELAMRFRGVYAAVGIHPNNSEDASIADIEHLEALVKKPGVKALGEMGLDFYRNTASREAQYKVLNWQLELANKSALPVIIHCRQAAPEMLEVLSKWAPASQLDSAKGIIHCFSGDINTVGKYIDMGFYIALGGYISYPSSVSFREVVRNIPLDRLVLETDCPFLPPQQYRGKRNEPAYTLFTLQLVAEIKKLSVEEVALKTTNNARAVLKISV